MSSGTLYLSEASVKVPVFFQSCFSPYCVTGQARGGCRIYAFEAVQLLEVWHHLHRDSSGLCIQCCCHGDPSTFVWSVLHSTCGRGCDGDAVQTSSHLVYDKTHSLAFIIECCSRCPPPLLKRMLPILFSRMRRGCEGDWNVEEKQTNKRDRASGGYVIYLTVMPQ